MFMFSERFNQQFWKLFSSHGFLVIHILLVDLYLGANLLFYMFESESLSHLSFIALIAGLYLLVSWESGRTYTVTFVCALWWILGHSLDWRIGPVIAASAAFSHWWVFLKGQTQTVEQSDDSSLQKIRIKD